MARAVVHQLGEDMPRRAGDSQPGTSGGAGDLLADPQVPPPARGRPRVGTRARSGLGASCLSASHLLLPSLSDLAADLLSRVPQPLTLVRVGLAELTDVGRDLADP